MNTILVTGGAGYIGSHVVQQLSGRGERVVVLDNLSSGFREAVHGAELVVGDVGDRALVSRVLREFGVAAVLHFAAHTVVPESVRNPLKYYGNNTCNTRNLLACCVEAGVGRFLFSSTAAVYGIPASGIADEDTPLQPINPYGTSKLMSEMMLRDVGATGAMRYVILRYFNVAGCDPQCRIGQSTPNATLLLKVACEHAVGKRPLGRRRHERQDREAGERRRCRDDADPGDIDADRLQPDREERQMDADDAESRGVKQADPHGKSTSNGLPCRVLL